LENLQRKESPMEITAYGHTFTVVLLGDSDIALRPNLEVLTWLQQVFTSKCGPSTMIDMVF